MRGQKGAMGVPEKYEENFKKAEMTFLHQRVWDPRSNLVINLTSIPWDHMLNPFDLSFLGPYPFSLYLFYLFYFYLFILSVLFNFVNFVITIIIIIILLFYYYYYYYYIYYFLLLFILLFILKKKLFILIHY